MIGLQLCDPSHTLSVLCLGAHSDDIEIGAGGTLLDWQAKGAKLNVLWCVLSATGDREEEARSSAASFLNGAMSARVEICQFRDGYFPGQLLEIKPWFEDLKARFAPDVIFTHRQDDAHQDHRQVSDLTWNTFRDHFILEYEIPKWDGDLGRPNLYVPLSETAVIRKADLLEQHFGSQSSKHWFDRETFSGLARLRGAECRAQERYAEAFFARKVALR